MRISVDSSENIASAKEDIELFGEGFKVFAIYAVQEVEGQDFEYISDYVDAERPVRDEVEEPNLWTDEDEKEYQQLVSDFEANISNLKKTKHELMTLAELLEKLEEQNRII